VDTKQHLLSFFNLIEAHVLNALRRRHRIALAKAKARIALDYLKKHFPSTHPLADREFETDGSDLFLQRYGQLINLSQEGQLAMRSVITEHLFAPDAADVAWFSDVERCGWIVLTKDDQIRYRSIELAAVVSARVMLFALASGNLTGEEMAQAFVAALPRMARVLARYHLPFIVVVT
jgi:hypothetical protein